MQIFEPVFEIRVVVSPSHPVHSGSGILLEFEERLPEQLDSDMVEERGELLLLPVPCHLPYAVQRLPGPGPGTCFADPYSPWPPPFVPPNSAADCSALFVSFPANTAESDFPSYVIGYGSSPFRHGEQWSDSTTCCPSCKSAPAGKLDAKQIITDAHSKYIERYTLGIDLNRQEHVDRATLTGSFRYRR